MTTGFIIEPSRSAKLNKADLRSSGTREEDDIGPS